MWIQKGGQGWQKVKWGMLKFLKLLLQKEMGWKKNLEYSLVCLQEIEAKCWFFSISNIIFAMNEGIWNRNSNLLRYFHACFLIQRYIFFHRWLTQLGKKKTTHTKPHHHLFCLTSSVLPPQSYKAVWIHIKLPRTGQAFIPLPLQIQSYHTNCAKMCHN